MTWVQSILDVCVVEEERSCIAVADELLKRVDAAISALRLNILPEGARVFCRVCGTGEYEPIKNSSNLHYIYFQPSGSGSSHPYEILTCKQCGHVDLFVRKEHQGRVAHA